MCWCNFRQPQVKVESSNLTGKERWDGNVLAGGIGAREIDVLASAHQQPHDGLLDRLFGAQADPDDDFGRRTHFFQRVSTKVSDTSAEQFGAMIAVALPGAGKS